MGRDLYSALIQFFKMFPKLQGRAFYITGESYAGKYVPSLGYAIHTNNPKAAEADRINLQVGSMRGSRNYLKGSSAKLRRLGEK